MIFQDVCFIMFYPNGFPTWSAKATASVLEDPWAAGGDLSTVHVVHGTFVKGTRHHHVVHFFQVDLTAAFRTANQEAFYAMFWAVKKNMWNQTQKWWTEINQTSPSVEQKSSTWTTRKSTRTKDIWKTSCKNTYDINLLFLKLAFFFPQPTAFQRLPPRSGPPCRASWALGRRWRRRPHARWHPRSRSCWRRSNLRKKNNGGPCWAIWWCSMFVPSVWEGQIHQTHLFRYIWTHKKRNRCVPYLLFKRVRMGKICQKYNLVSTCKPIHGCNML